MAAQYIFFYLEIALKNKDDNNIYAFENVSHIPTDKLIEIFKIDLEKDPHILDGYFLTKSSYKKYKKYIYENIVNINLDLFEYCLRRYESKDLNCVRKLYKKTCSNSKFKNPQYSDLTCSYPLFSSYS